MKSEAPRTPPAPARGRGRVGMTDNRPQETATPTNREVISTNRAGTRTPPSGEPITTGNKKVISTSGNKRIAIPANEVISIGSEETIPVAAIRDALPAPATAHEVISTAVDRKVASTNLKETISPAREASSTAADNTLNPPAALNATPPDLRQETQAAFLHHLKGTTKAVPFSDAVTLVSEELGHSPQFLHWGQTCYTKTARWAGGLTLQVNDRRPDMGICLTADGDACDYYGSDTLIRLYIKLSLRASRLDLAAEPCPFTPDQLREPWCEGQVVTQARFPRKPKAGRENFRNCDWHESSTGDTFTMGLRGSTQLARCYDMRKVTRFEMELHRARAAQVMKVLCDGAPLAPTLGAVISQFVTFIEPPSSNCSRCAPLPFWAEFMESLDVADVNVRPPRRAATTAERLIAYVENNLAALIAVYLILKGGSDNREAVVEGLVRRGLERAKPEYRALIDAVGGWPE
jgi:hypothetical protein